jgi:hypothetical protein
MKKSNTVCKMGSKKADIIDVICPACGQEHRVPKQSIRTALSAATMQCANCKTMFSSAEQGVRPTPAPGGPNIKLLVFVFILIVLLLILMFLVYAARRSGGDTPLDALPEQVKIALLGGGEHSWKDELQGLEIKVKEGYKLTIRDKAPVLVVKGSVSNPGDVTRTKILLEGRIVDKEGGVRFVARAPCGKVLSDKRLKRTKRGKFSTLFTRKKEFLDCTLRPGEEKTFQMIFDDIPKDYDEEYTVQVKTLLAGVERADAPSSDTE